MDSSNGIDAPHSDPMGRLLAEQGTVILDGGLATEVEDQGHDLADALWSARLLVDDPEALGRANTAFLEAGADCVATASYQATLEGFRRRGLGSTEARERLCLSVDLAREARNRFWESGPENRRRPLVAASVGPYGAARADGSEYTGDYDLDEAGLRHFHAERFALLAGAGADLLAFETIPSRLEARVLLKLVDETPGARAWFSFSARDAGHISDGTPVAEVARELDHERVVAIGVNCVPPSLVPGLLEELRGATRRPLAAYPNSGEGWDAGEKRWTGSREGRGTAQDCVAWRDAGARLIGGCCRVGPAEIGRMRERLLGPVAAGRGQ